MLLFWVASDVLGDNDSLFVSMIAVIAVILALQHHVCLPKEIKSLLQNSLELITPNK